MLPWAFMDRAMEGKGRKGDGKGEEMVHNPLFRGATWLDL